VPQFVHAAPFVPQAAAVGGEVHVEPEQQPDGQVVDVHPVQTPPEHVPGLQLAHMAPPVPHSLLAFPGSHTFPWQQPVHPEVALQTHAPPEQIWPVEQAAPPPHVHVPVAEQPSPVLPQLTHADPLAPQFEPDVGVTQAPPAQQPLGHDVESQTHAPPWQICPVPHAAPGPHEHAPEVEQLSAFVGSQVTHALPFVPQLESDAVSHVVPEQQPAGQEAALQTHLPLTHAWPAPQGALPPQAHAPDAEHVSALVGSHAVHATPLTPHVTNADVLHVEPEQQPVAQSVAPHPLHVPEAVQVCGLGQVSQAPPPLPHALVVSPAWQVLLASQHPVGHEVELQTHTPLAQT
jgi:hypothetical protein